MSQSEKQMQALSVFVHGVLCGLHALGIAYNAKRKNQFETMAHVAGAAFSLWAVHKHLATLKELNDL